MRLSRPHDRGLLLQANLLDRRLPVHQADPAHAAVRGHSAGRLLDGVPQAEAGAARHSERSRATHPGRSRPDPAAAAGQQGGPVPAVPGVLVLLHLADEPVGADPGGPVPRHVEVRLPGGPHAGGLGHLHVHRAHCHWPASPPCGPPTAGWRPAPLATCRTATCSGTARTTPRRSPTWPGSPARPRCCPSTCSATGCRATTRTPLPTTRTRSCRTSRPTAPAWTPCRWTPTGRAPTPGTAGSGTRRSSPTRRRSWPGRRPTTST